MSANSELSKEVNSVNKHVAGNPRFIDSNTVMIPTATGKTAIWTWR
jgi:hypothetical protein